MAGKRDLDRVLPVWRRLFTVEANNIEFPSSVDILFMCLELKSGEYENILTKSASRIPHMGPRKMEYPPLCGARLGQITQGRTTNTGMNCRMTNE
jgi:hypothetical protein